MSYNNKNTKIINILFLSCLILIGQVQKVWSEENKKDISSLEHLVDSNIACGVQCLYAAALLCNIQVDLLDLAHQAKLNQYGSTMLELKRAAELSGFQATGYKYDYEEWRTLKPLSIVHTKSKDIEHYMLILDVNDTHVKVLNPPGKLMLLSKDEFCDIWTSNVLELIPIDINNRKKPEITILVSEKKDINSVFDFGQVKAGREIKANIVIENKLNEEIFLKNIKNSCGCLVIDKKINKILSNTKEVVSIKLFTSGLAGKFNKGMVMQFLTKESNFNIFVSTLGEIPTEGKLLVFPNKLDIDVVQGEHKESKILVRREGNEKILFKEVLSSEPWLICKKIGNVDQESESRIDLEISIDASFEGMNIGVHEGKISVITEDLRHPMLDIPVKCKVISPIKIKPVEVICKISEPQEEQKRSIVLSSYDNKKIEVEKVEFIPKSLGKIYNVENSDDSSITLEVGINKPKDSKYIKGMLRASVNYLDSEYIEEIPIAVITD